MDSSNSNQCPSVGFPEHMKICPKCAPPLGAHESISRKTQGTGTNPNLNYFQLFLIQPKLFQIIFNPTWTISNYFKSNQNYFQLFKIHPNLFQFILNPSKPTPYLSTARTNISRSNSPPSSLQTYHIGYKSR